MFEQRLQGSLSTIQSLAGHLGSIARISDIIIERLGDRCTVWTAGNGGSAAQALHLSEELVGRYRDDRRPLASAMLASDPTALTCIANDYGFEYVFERPLRAMARPKDVLLVLSTSGNSPNLVRALEAARSFDCLTIGLLGGDGGKCRQLCDHALVVDETDSAFIQDAHQVVIHLICEAVEQWATASPEQEIAS
ncbi:MAG: SIS domain-containing protein [Planctomycetes bacterium]|jgi:D-sedoheptulose 7-phosphate isomerase|nr:SIS domain-containing protein [Planctomycetota bacterium]MCP4838476.1 SIS domain-containing protein [Planctomycetota bacterium]